MYQYFRCFEPADFYYETYLQYFWEQKTRALNSTPIEWDGQSLLEHLFAITIFLPEKIIKLTRYMKQLFSDIGQKAAQGGGF